MKEIRKTAIVGMGALGMMYGEHIARHAGNEAVAYVLDEGRMERYARQTFTVNGEAMEPQFHSAALPGDFDLVMVAVKYNALPAALETMKNCIGPDTITLSVMNGIDSEEIIGARYGMERMICCVAQGMDAMRDGSALRYTQMGKLCIGVTDEQNIEHLDAVERFFRRIQMPYIREEDIRYRMWAKWMLNVGINQCCMVFDTSYSGVLDNEERFGVLTGAMKEVIALSRLEGVNLRDSEVDFYVGLLRTLDPDGYPSMEQDRRAGRRTEVEMFAGTVLRLAAKHGMAAPANRFLYDEVQKVEAAL